MSGGDEYDEVEATIRVPRGQTLDKSRSTEGARRATTRDVNGHLAGQAEIILKQPSEQDGSDSPSESLWTWEPSIAEDVSFADERPDVSGLVPLALVAAAGVAAGVAGVKIAQRAKERRADNQTKQHSMGPATVPPAGWYEVSSDSNRLRYWDGTAWTNEFAQRRTNTSIPADWYPDPSDAMQLRYWDGSAWTHHVAPKAGVTSTPADWYPDPSDPTKLRYWDGVAWTAHVASGSGTALGSPRPTAPSPAPALASSPPVARVSMTGEEWQQCVRAWMAAGMVQQELWTRLSNAHIEDADEATLAAQRRMEELSPQQAAHRIRLMLEANPSLRNNFLMADIARILDRVREAGHVARGSIEQTSGSRRRADGIA
jgi:hypothetical protein